MLQIKKNNYINYYKISFILLIFCFFSYDSAYCYNLGNIDLKIKGGVSQSYNDNITFIQNERKEDHITRISIGMDAEYKEKTKSFGCYGNLYRKLFYYNNDFDNNSGNFKLNFVDEFSKYDRIKIENYFTREYDLRNLGDAFGRISGSYSYFLNRISLEYLREIKKHMDLSIKYANEINKYSKEDILRSNLNSIHFNGDYILSRDVKILLLYEYSERKFNSADIASRHLISTGMVHYLTKKIYLDNKAGFAFIKAYDNEKYVKPVIYCSIAEDMSEYSNVKISFEKQYNTVPYLQSLLYYWQVSGQFNRLLIKRLKSSLMGYYNQGEYISTGITKKNIGSIFGLNYEIKENFEGTISYDFSRAKSLDKSQEYTTNIITFDIIYSFK